MKIQRTEVHCHFLPEVDDGCEDVAASLACLRMMADAGYTRVFCTPHCGESGFSDLSTPIVADLVKRLVEEVRAAGIPIDLRPGGELRLSQNVVRDLKETGIPSYGHSGKFILTDLWTNDWPKWATTSIEWLQAQGLQVILAHPERLQYLRRNPAQISELAKLGLLFQGNLGPIAGADAPDIVELANRYLQEGRYFLVATDGHRPSHLATRLAGLQHIEELVGPEALHEMTEKNAGRLWT